VTVQITAGADTGGSGVQKTTYLLSGATTLAETTIASGGTITISAGGTTTITAYTYDNAGNKSIAATLVINRNYTVVAATVSGTYSTYVATLAFDNNTSTYWNSGGYAPQWIQFDLGTSKPLSRIDIMGQALPDVTGTINIQGSNDGTTYTTIVSSASITGTGTSLVWTPNIALSGTYRYVKINIPAYGASWVAIREIEIH